MRILVANDGFGDAGGVQRYLDACLGALAARGHALAILHRDPVGDPARVSPLIASLPQFSVADGLDGALASVRAWAPDVCFSHNMDRLEVDRRLADLAPVVKFMHGYFGTCVGGQKRRAWPVARPCDRTFGPACAALFVPCRCGSASVTDLVRQYAWAGRQRDLFATYRGILVASRHMQREYVANGAPEQSVHVVPLFPTVPPVEAPVEPAVDPTIAFLGRVTPLKGAGVLIRAVALARRRLGASIKIVLVGDGPDRRRCEALARRVGADCTFLGWIDSPARFDLVRRAHLVAVPSTWPEPFGLVGLEGAAFGVPAVAFDVGGVSEWLTHGVNGFLAPADPPTAETMAEALVQAFSDRARLRSMRASALRVAHEMSLGRHVDAVERLLARSAAVREDASRKEPEWARA